MLANDHSRLFVNASKIVDSTADAGYGVGIDTSHRSFVDVVGGSQIARFLAGKHIGGNDILQHAHITMVASDIVNCHAFRGGGIYGSSGSVVAVIASRLEGCSAEVSGGGIYARNGSCVLVANATIVDCVAGSSGGGMHVNSRVVLKVAGSQITGCKGLTDSGGAINGYTDTNISVTHSEITNCTATSGGGMLVAQGGTLVVHRSRIAACRSTADSHGGGGIFGEEYSRIRVDGSVIVDCLALYGAGGVVSFSVVEIVGGSLIKDCVAGQRAGGISGEQGSSITVKDSAIIGCSAVVGYAGGIYGNAASTITANNVRIENCSSSGGGALFVSGGARVILKQIFIARNEADYGGAILLTRSEAITLSDCHLSENVARYDGGAIYVYAGVFVHLIGSVRIEANEARGCGAGIYAEGTDEDYPVILISSPECTWVTVQLDFTQCEEGTFGTSVIIYSEATRNVLDFRGRDTTLLPVEQGFLTDYFCLAPGDYSFEGYNKQCYGWGGGTATLSFPLGFDTKIALSVSTCAASRSFAVPETNDADSTIFRGNRAAAGGALYLKKSARTFIDAAVFDANNAAAASTSAGGAIYAKEFARVDATRCILTENIASELGGAAYAQQLSAFALRDSLVSANVATNGGGLAFTKTTGLVTVTGTLVRANVASGGLGAGIFSDAFEPSGILEVTDVTFLQNFADGPKSAGAGCAIQDSAVMFGDVNFESNVVRGGQGGGGVAALVGSRAEFATATDDCVSSEVHIDFRSTNERCQVLTCNSGESCELYQRVYNCAGCACWRSAERGVHVDGDSGNYLEVATAITFGFARTTLCLPRNETYRAQAFDLLGRSMDGANWSVVFLGPGYPVNVTGFAGFVKTPDGAMHYLGSPVRGDESKPISFYIAPAVSREDQSFMRENIAHEGGGGALLIDAGVSSTDIEPLGWHDNVVLISNNATYGPDEATPPRQLRLRTTELTAKSGEVPTSLHDVIVVELRDAFGVLVNTETGSTAVAEVVAPLGATVTNRVAFFMKGVAKFESALITAQPNTTVVVNISSTIPTLRTSSVKVLVHLLPCDAGEVLVAISEMTAMCSACERGTYWYDHKCVTCESGMICDDTGLTLADAEAANGRYRTTMTSRTFHKCPSKGSGCPGGPGAGLDLCRRPGYRGQVCGACDPNWYPRIAGDSRLKCFECARGSAVRAASGLACIVVIVVLFLEFGLLTKPGQNRVRAWIGEYAADNQAADDPDGNNNLAVMAMWKILIG